MKITFLGNGLVWTGNRKNMIRFVDGKYATEDKAEIERLRGYPTDPVGAYAEYIKPVVKRKPAPKKKVD